MKKNRYNYFIQVLSDEDGIGYKAIIPKFPKIHVYADSVKELDEQINICIEMAVTELTKAKKSIPPPDTQAKFKGKVMLRIPPELHEQLYFEAQAHKTSLNKYIESKLAQ